MDVDGAAALLPILHGNADEYEIVVSAERLDPIKDACPAHRSEQYGVLSVKRALPHEAGFKQRGMGRRVDVEGGMCATVVSFEC